MTKKKNRESGKKDEVKIPQVGILQLWPWTIKVLVFIVLFCIFVALVTSSQMEKMAKNDTVRVDVAKQALLVVLFGLAVVVVAFMFWLESSSNSSDREILKEFKVQKRDDSQADLERSNRERRILLNLYSHISGSDLVPVSTEPLDFQQLESLLAGFAVAARRVTLGHLGQIKALTEGTGKSDSEIKSLRAEIGELKGKHQEALKAGHDTAQDQIANLNRQHGTRVQELTAKNTDLEMSLERVRFERALVEEEVEHQQTNRREAVFQLHELSMETADRDDLFWQLADAYRLADESRDELVDRNATLENLLALHEGLTAKLLLCVRHLRRQVVFFENQSELLLDDNRTLLSDFFDAQGQVSDLEHELDQLQERLVHQQRLQLATASERDGAFTRVGVLSRQVEAVSAQFKTVQDLADRFQNDSDIAQAKVAQLTSQLRNLSAERDQFSQQVVSLQAQLQARPTVSVSKSSSPVEVLKPSDRGSCRTCDSHQRRIDQLRIDLETCTDRTARLLRDLQELEVQLRGISEGDGAEFLNRILEIVRHALITSIALLSKK